MNNTDKPGVYCKLFSHYILLVKYAISFEGAIKVNSKAFQQPLHRPWVFKISDSQLVSF